MNGRGLRRGISRRSSFMDWGEKDGGAPHADNRRRGARNKGEKRRPPLANPFARRAPPVHRARTMAEAAGPFMRVEREDASGKSRHFVVHVRDPKFAVEMTPDTDAPDKVGAGVIKRVSVPNCWAGQYSRYSTLLKAAQEFFRQSLLTEPAAKTETRRLKF
jgi:hypothetical protein